MTATARVLVAPVPQLRTCRGCGCTDLRACPGGCAWVLLDIDAPSGICSTCAEAFEWDALQMANEGWYRDEESEFERGVLLP